MEKNELCKHLIMLEKCEENFEIKVKTIKIVKKLKQRKIEKIRKERSNWKKMKVKMMNGRKEWKIIIEKIKTKRKIIKKNEKTAKKWKITIFRWSVTTIFVGW